MKLMKVMKDRVIIWPDEFNGPNPEEMIRAKAGDVIDVEGPLEQDIVDEHGRVKHRGWLTGQMGKFVDAPEGSMPIQIKHPRARGMLEKFKDECTKADRVQPSSSNEGMPEVDPVPPQRGKKAGAPTA